jgi:hypothetical protein
VILQNLLVFASVWLLASNLIFVINMANPRKFSEKIALHNKKQAEETAAFEAVLREVSATTQVS